jgi:hypothetical protein
MALICVANSVSVGGLRVIKVFMFSLLFQDSFCNSNVFIEPLFCTLYYNQIECSPYYYVFYSPIQKKALTIIYIAVSLSINVYNHNSRKKVPFLFTLVCSGETLATASLSSPPHPPCRARMFLILTAWI